MNDVLTVTLAWLAAAVAVATAWLARPKKSTTARELKPTGKPSAAVIEIVERGRATDDSIGGSVILPNDIRINGQSLLAPAGQTVTIHEIDLKDGDLACVTLTLFARRITVAAEHDL
ncbi:hypothetical protein G3I51_24305 [Streptomyces sp. SID9944]|nr:hypothetical protein [Streptomyces sp. SID9944]